MRATCRPLGPRGFLLIEVMVATTLLAVGVTAALNAIFSSLKATSEARMYSKALFLGQKVMSELEARATLNDEYTVPRAGVFEDYPNYRWQAASENIDRFWTRQIRVTIIWADDPRKLYDDDECFFYRLVTEVRRARYPEDYEK
ncbi:MAG: prepilin-type N-terminal cleavage/methylation domain-containing protein [Candidatus Omnitrophica bacterium]|nr:hypothetical protein [bacterium]NUN96905.1 prepilin-type N-terminal cleavage/methylation domain-containing protein [Candidatus Omnitrophota bacterium]